MRDLRAKPLVVAILASWGIAFFDYVLQVPANRIGYGIMSLAQLKVVQEVITLWAGLCLVGAVYCAFRA